jgi:transposase
VVQLRDEQDLRASLASLKRWVAATLPEEVHRDRVTVLGEDGEPGAEAQIDYGHLGSWLDPRSGKKHRVWAFVMVLVCSRLMFVRPVLRMDQRAWTEAHVEAFDFFNGVPARLVPDNLKTGVDKPDLYDPKLNRSYAELAEHYDTLIDPARAAKPKDKPRVAYCTSSGRWMARLYLRCSAVCEAVSLVRGWWVGAWRVVEHFVFVVVALSADKSGAVPVLDGRGGDAEACGHLGERDQSEVAQALFAAA